ncbi:GIY-YIG nuclease family protein [Agromyces sp. Marseille-P2726]|uniref:GIY-YIG nuclease family protein n=1 Tax=Agromyces sp. Marseille-P2726 TaxID=2709132 RepID=UPI00156E9A9F|nr:GIY-YIG nuclease family protein [Agromyces sp. Marseille-P2726]
MAYLYILECADGTLYVGSTIDVERRFAQHQRGEGSAYTRRRLPVRLVYTREFSRIGDAFALEKQVQGWSRAKRLALIEGRLDAFPSLSRKRRQRGIVELRGGATTELG